ncbi:hypothetical protein Tco_0613594 [Tanacetum coccineum]
MHNDHNLLKDYVYPHLEERKLFLNYSSEAAMFYTIDCESLPDNAPCSRPLPQFVARPPQYTRILTSFHGLEAKSKLLEAAKLHVHIGLNTYLGKINTRVLISSYELSTLNSASNCKDLASGGIECGFLSQKGSRGGRGVKEKSVNVSNIEAVKEKDINDEHVAMKVKSPLVEHTNAMKIGEGSYPPLPTQDLLWLETPLVSCEYSYIIYTKGNGIDVVVPVKSIRAISERFVNTAYGFFLVGEWLTALLLIMLGTLVDAGNVPVWVKLHGGPVTAFSEDGLSTIATKLDTLFMLDSYTSDMCLQSWGTSSYAKVMIELRADMMLKDNIVVAMPKIMREGYYTCTVCVEYEWKPLRCSYCKVFGHTQEEYLKNIGLGMVKNLKNPSQTSRGFPVGPKKGVAHTNEVSNSNPFDVLNSVDNDVEFGTDGGTTNLVNNEAISSGSSFMNVENSSTCNTPIIDKIRMFKDLLIDGQAILVDKAGNLLKKVECLGYYDSEDEVASVDNDMTRSLASERVGFGTQSLLEQWRDSYGNGDYDEDPYDDYMYEGQDLQQEIQAICDNLDIQVRGRKKK